MRVVAQIGSEPATGRFSGYCENRNGFNQNSDGILIVSYERANASAPGDIHSQTTNVSGITQVTRFYGAIRVDS